MFTIHFRKKDIENFARITRLKIINSVSGIKSANLIFTIDDNGNTNLAILSSVLHLESNPALMDFLSRLIAQNIGHPFINISLKGCYTINHIHPEFIKNTLYFG